MGSQLKNLLLSLLIATVMMLIISGSYYYFKVGVPQEKQTTELTVKPDKVEKEKGVAYYLLQLLGAEMPGGLIQYITFIMFWFGVLEILHYNRQIKREYRAFDLKILPEKEQYVLSPEDVNDLKLAAIRQESVEPFFVTGIIKKACTKYRSNKSVSEVMDVVSAQIRISLSQSEGSQAMIRYVASAMLSVGFIGTIIGIAIAMDKADDVLEDAKQISGVTSALMLAFNTTLVALILSIIMNYLYHKLQENEQTYHTDVESYIIENLINRIHPE